MALTMGVGIVVAADAVCAVVASRRAVLRSSVVFRMPDTCVVAAVRDVLSRLAIPRWSRPRVAIALGPRDLNVRELHGLPPVAKRSMLQRGVAQQRTRYMPRTSETDIVRVTRRSPDEVTIAMAMSERLIEELTNELKAQGCVLKMVLPSVIADWISQARSDAIARSEDGLTTHITATNGWVESYRVERTNAVGEREEAKELESIDQAWDMGLRVAEGAALALRFSDSLIPCIIVSAPIPAWRLPIATTAVGVAALALFFAPIIKADLAKPVTQLSSGQMNAALRAHGALTSEIRGLADRLRDIQVFERTSGSALGELALLTRALPPQLALSDYRRDSSGSLLTVVGPRAGTAVQLLQATSGIVSAELNGPVTREQVGEVVMERATVRLRLAPERVTPALVPALSRETSVDVRGRE